MTADEALKHLRTLLKAAMETEDQPLKYRLLREMRQLIEKVLTAN